MIRPGSLLLRGLAAIAVIALLAIWWKPFGLMAIGLGIALLLLAAGEAFLLARITVQVERPARLAVSLGAPLTLSTSISHDAAAELAFVVRQRLDESLGGGSVTRSGRCPAGTLLTVEMVARGSRRGSAPLEPPGLAFSRYGLIERMACIGTPSEIAVLPDLGAVRRLRRQLDAVFLRGLGTRMSPRLGQGRDFERLREYVQGDDWRHIEWKASARRGQIIVRELRVERAQDIVLCIDHGHRMAALVSGPHGLLSRCDHAVNAGMLTAWLAERCSDRIGMLSFSAEVEQGIAQGRGAAHLAAMTTFATGITPAWLHTDYRALAAHLSLRLKQRSLVLIITVLPESGDYGELVQATRLLLVRHLPLVLVLSDPLLDATAHALPQDRRGLCRTLVAADLVDGRRQLMRTMRQLGALVVETVPEDCGIAAINGYLEVKRRQLL